MQTPPNSANIVYSYFYPNSVSCPFIAKYLIGLKNAIAIELLISQPQNQIFCNNPQQKLGSGSFFLQSRTSLSNSNSGADIPQIAFRRKTVFNSQNACVTIV
jgi:hypothetical protein